MEQHEIHDLTAPYALHALDEDDEREYEEHLRTCERCRAELHELSEVAAALAFGAEGPEPPAGLRGRILESARAERSNVVPLRPPRRGLVWASTAAAAAAAAVAVGLGLWGNSLSGDLDRERERLAVLADPDAARVPLDGADGTLVRSESGQSVLLLSGLERAPAGKTYEIWVIPSEEDAPQPAGLFEAGGGNDVVVLTRPAHAGATIAVTLEREGGVDSPTGSPLFTARA